MSPTRVVLVGGADMLQDVVRQVVNDDPVLELVGESATLEGLPGLWQRIEADVVIVRPLAVDMSAAVLRVVTDAHIPAVLALDHRGTHGMIILNDISRTRLAAAIRAAAELCGHQEAG